MCSSINGNFVLEMIAMVIVYVDNGLIDDNVISSSVCRLYHVIYYIEPLCISSCFF